MMNFLRQKMAFVVLPVLLVLAIAVFELLNIVSYGRGSSDTYRDTQVLGGSFTLVAADGRTMGPASWPGKILVITFGYRFCPDVCPTNLATMARALDRLGSDGARIQPLFITIDPERDTPEPLRDYVRLFHPRLIGLTGTPEQIDDVARKFRVYYRKVEGSAPDNYTMDHTAFFFAVDDHGSVLKVFNPNITDEQLAERLKGLL